MANTKPRSISAPGAENSSGLGARLAALRDSRRRKQITWGDADDQKLSTAIEGLVEAGSLVSFGRTSDGGALMLNVVTDGAPSKFYVTTQEELDDLVTELAIAASH